MIEVIARSRSGLPFERRLTRGEATAFTLSDPDFDPAATWLVRIDGEAVAYGSAGVDSNRISAGKNDGHFDFDVVREKRGQCLEQELLDRSVGYLRRRGVRTALSRCEPASDWKKELLLSNSFKEYYTVYNLVRRGQTEVVAAPLPDGFSIERKLFKNHEDDEIGEFVKLFNESFFDHLNFAPEKPMRFINWRNETSDVLMISKVRSEDRFVGFCLSEESVSFNVERGTKVGWIDILGVASGFRRRGLARAVLSDGLRWIMGRGMDTVYISVISQNEKALDLYKSFGFEKEHESVWFEKRISD